MSVTKKDSLLGWNNAREGRDSENGQHSDLVDNLRIGKMTADILTCAIDYNRSQFNCRPIGSQHCDMLEIDISTYVAPFVVLTPPGSPSSLLGA
jgi:hypothetical protein